MKSLFALSCLVVILSGCAVTIKVIDKREPTVPYKKILVLYLDEGCDFTLFDSISYSICVKNSFAKEGSQLLRNKVESLVAEDLTTVGTAVLKSSDLPDSSFDNYAAFQGSLDSYGIDGVLLIDFRDYKHIAHPIPSPMTPRGLNTPAFNAPSRTYVKLKAGFACYLLPAKSLYFPVWYAHQEVEGRRSAEEKGLKSNMADKIAKALKKGGYIAH